MKLFLKTTLAVALFSSTSALASPYKHSDLARVTSVEPIYETVERRIPREQCWVETVREERPRHRRRSAAPAIIGGIIGGVLGNEVGKGKDNQKLGAVVGSVLGVSIAKDIQRHHERKHRHSSGHYDAHYRDVERCETHYDIESEKILEGYDVSYRYQGREYSTFMDERPGKKIRVAVSVTPLGGAH